MIQDHEVRKGNLVMYDGRVFKIHAITELPHLDTDEFGSGVVTWNDLSGVPITEEWLLGVGFEKSIFGNTFRIGKFAVIFFTTGIITTEYKNIEIIEVEFVHQLQNLYFAMTGEELE